MIAFDIVDGRRNARPCGQLLYDPTQEQWAIRIAPDAQPTEVPFMLALFLERGEREIGMPWAARWVEERLVPSGRQNLGEVLRAYGLDDYDEVALLSGSRGACSHDDFILKGPYDPDDRQSVGNSRDQVRKAVGNALAQARRAQGLTQMQLAERAGIDQAVVSRVERGRANATLDLVADLAEALGVRLTIGIDRKASGAPLSR